MSLFSLDFAVRTSSNSKYSPMVFDVMAFRGVMPNLLNIRLSSLLILLATEKKQARQGLKNAV